MNLQDAIALFIGGIAGYAQQGNYSLGTAIYKVISLIFIGLYVVPLLMYIVNVPSEYSVGVYALLGYLSIEVLVTIKKVFPIITQAVTDKVTGKTRLEYVGPDIKISNDKIGKKKKHKKNIKNISSTKKISHVRDKTMFEKRDARKEKMKNRLEKRHR